MSSTLKEMLERVEAWPEEDQAELAEYAREIQARRTGQYRLTDEERIAVKEGLAQAERGEFVPEEEMQAFWTRHGIV